MARQAGAAALAKPQQPLTRTSLAIRRVIVEVSVGEDEVEDGRDIEDRDTAVVVVAAPCVRATSIRDEVKKA